MFRKGLTFAIILACLLIYVPKGVQAADNSAVSFYVFGDAAEKAAYETLISAFNQKHPEITVNLVYTQGEDEFKFGDDEDAYRQRLSLDFSAGKPPDVFMFNYREYGIFASKGALEPVGPYLDKSSVIKVADFYPPALVPFTGKDNVLNCLPQTASPLVVYYNKDLFDKAKIAYPKDNWTWDDFLTAAKALTSGSKATAQYGLVTEKDFTRVMPLIWQNGGEIVDSYTAPTKLTLDTPEAKTAMQWFFDLQLKYHVVPDEATSSAMSITDRFLSGTVGMMFFSRRITPTLRTAKFDWDVAPLPQNKTAATLLYSDGYCMSKAGKNKDAAWTLIEYANSVDGQTVLAKTGRTVPSLKAVAESPAFLDPTAKPKNSKLFIDLIPTSRTAPIIDNWADIEEQINQQLETAWYDGQAIDATVKAINDNTEDLFKTAP